MRVALAQINPVVGDLLGNAERILQARGLWQGLSSRGWRDRND